MAWPWTSKTPIVWSRCGRQDWGLLGCRARPGETLFFHNCGSRLTQYFAGALVDQLLHLLFVLLYADDWLVLQSGPATRLLLGVFFLLLAVLRFPVSWGKVSGGGSIKWIATRFCFPHWRSD